MPEFKQFYRYNINLYWNFLINIFKVFLRLEINQINLESKSLNKLASILLTKLASIFSSQNFFIVYLF